MDKARDKGDGKYLTFMPSLFKIQVDSQKVVLKGRLYARLIRVRENGNVCSICISSICVSRF